MNKETVTHTKKARAAHPKHTDLTETVEAALPEGSWQRLTAGVVAAAGGGLIAAAVVGVGPAALAGAAGYLAYRKMTETNGKKH
jgi:hypothetical protein